MAEKEVLRLFQLFQEESDANLTLSKGTGKKSQQKVQWVRMIIGRGSEYTLTFMYF